MPRSQQLQLTLPSPNWTVRSLNRSINISAFSTVPTIRLHPGSCLVKIYHCYLTSYVLILINLESYGSIAEEYVFTLTETGRAVVVLETVVMMAPERAVKKAARIVGSMMAIEFALMLLFLSSS